MVCSGKVPSFLLIFLPLDRKLAIQFLFLKEVCAGTSHCHQLSYILYL
nr:MAG TPA: hypothetical protein [Caudoviricetes sp.]